MLFTSHPHYVMSGLYAYQCKQMNNDFGLIGGSVENEESPIDAAIRETKEETGLAIHQVV